MITVTANSQSVSARFAGGGGGRLNTLSSLERPLALVNFNPSGGRGNPLGHITDNVIPPSTTMRPMFTSIFIYFSYKEKN